jgi:hypothetical protein
MGMVSVVRESGHEMTYKGRDRGRYEALGGSGLSLVLLAAGKERTEKTGERKVYTGWRVKRALLTRLMVM